MHVAESSYPAKLEVEATSRLTEKRGRQITFRDLRAGDQVQTSAVPTPDRALVYLAQWVQDHSLRFVKGLQGYVAGRDLKHGVLNVKSGRYGWVRVAATRNTQFLGGASAHQLRDVRHWDAVVINGFLNKRIGWIVRATRIRVQHARG